MSISDQITRLNNAKAAIKQAISNKGIEVSDEAKLDEYPALIDSIKTDDFLVMRTLNHTNYYRLFSDYAGDSLDAFYIEQWDTSNVTDMAHMFSGCINLTIVDLSSFDTSNVITMGQMFNSCSNLETVDIRNFNLFRTQSYGGMFYNCNNLHTLRLDNCNNDTINKIINSSLFPTGAIDGIQRKIYVNPNNIDGLEAPENWIFVDLDGNEIIFGPKLYVPYEFKGKTGLTEVTTMVNESHTDLSNMFDCCYNLATINGIEQWNTSNVTKMNHMFNYCQKLIELDLSSFNTSNVTTMYAMFMNCSNLEILDIRNFDTTNVTEMRYMFSLCYELRELRLDNCSNDTINKIITSDGFPTGAILDVTRKIYVNPDNIGNLEAPNGWVFVDSDGNEIVPKEPEIYQVGYYRDNSEITEATTMVNSTHTDLSNMFNGCTNLTTINNIEQWDTSNVTTMNDMFYGCYNLFSLDLSSFNTSNVITMGFMFKGCSNLETLNISNFDMSKVENTDLMFASCFYLQQLRLDNCSAETVEKIINDCDLPTGDINGEKRIMYVNSKAANVLKPIDGWIFVDYETLTEIKIKEPALPYEEGQFAKNTDMTVANTLVTEEHEFLNGMFGGCTNLAVVNTSDWNTSNVVHMDGMFSGCENLPYLYLPNFNTSNVVNMIDMFAGCTDLLYLDISNFTVGENCNTGKESDSGMFWGCTSLLDLRLDNCDTDTIDRIISSKDFPTGNVDGKPRVIYVREENGRHLSAPDDWEFGYIEDPVYITNKNDETKWEYIDNKEIVNVIVDTQADFDRYEDISLDRLFENCGNLRLINGIEQWNTTGIEYMTYMFAGCSNLVSLNLSSFDISNVRDIYNMFDGCTNLRYLDISNFIMGEEYFNYNTRDMFRDCNNLRHLRLDNCDRYTIEKIIHDSDLPMGDIDGEKRKIYVQEANVDGLEARDGWEFIYLVEAKKEEE